MLNWTAILGSFFGEAPYGEHPRENAPPIGFGVSPKPHWCEAFEITAQFKIEVFFGQIGLQFWGRFRGKARPIWSISAKKAIR